jgi:hypothetical protein
MTELTGSGSVAERDYAGKPVTRPLLASTVICCSKTEASNSRRSANTTSTRSTPPEPEVGTLAARLASAALLRSSCGTLWRSPWSVIPHRPQVRSAPAAHAAQRPPW